MARRGVGGQKMLVPKIPEKISFYPQNVRITFLVIENCNKVNTQQKCHRRGAAKLSAPAARRSTKVGGGLKLSAAAHGSISNEANRY